LKDILYVVSPLIKVRVRVRVWVRVRVRFQPLGKGYG